MLLIMGRHAVMHDPERNLHTDTASAKTGDKLPKFWETINGSYATTHYKLGEHTIGASTGGRVNQLDVTYASCGVYIVADLRPSLKKNIPQ